MRLLVLILFSSLTSGSALINLRTSTKIADSSKAEVLEFFATPTNWPKIVLSSWEVHGTTDTLRRGDPVREVFGFPPLVPLAVDWICTETNSRKGILDVQSTAGVRGLASDCRMRFDINENGDQSVSIDLTMTYKPQNMLGTLAIPILSVDNWMALNLFFPSESQKSRAWSPLDQFRELMGVVYCWAGLTHLFDCIVGDSRLLQAAGSPAFFDLPIGGQVLVLTWCWTGSLSYILSKLGRGDLGIVIYGLVEVSCAALVAASFPSSSSDLDPLSNALMVQLIVAGSWIYSSQKKDSA